MLKERLRRQGGRGRGEEVRKKEQLREGFGLFSLPSVTVTDEGLISH